ncbi:46444_t:CDS:2 [Gigaspora margarita]|uniref:46444_t:CDS:1 n=1 Tax=Gigaspora margarita TaxID=4874 RepID=A0ABN7X1A7_GIGMA|nr:46444_t:CDS:2 [Gigaspora margarita]
MDNTKKWNLQLEQLWKMPFITLAYVANMNNPYNDTYLKENVFTKSELQEIREFQNKQMLLMLTELLQYLNSFNLPTTSELRKQMFKPDQMDQDFNKSRDFD